MNISRAYYFYFLRCVGVRYIDDTEERGLLSWFNKKKAGFVIQKLDIIFYFFFFFEQARKFFLGSSDYMFVLFTTIRHRHSVLVSLFSIISLS